MENQNIPQQSDSSNRTIMGILAYVGPLVIVSYLVAKDDPFVKFHIKQGLVLLVIEVAVWFLGMIFWPLWMLFSLVNLVTFIFSIVGIVNVAQGKEKNLPIVGDYAKYFKF